MADKKTAHRATWTVPKLHRIAASLAENSGNAGTTDSGNPARS